MILYFLRNKVEVPTDSEINNITTKIYEKIEIHVSTGHDLM